MAIEGLHCLDERRGKVGGRNREQGVDKSATREGEACSDEVEDDGRRERLLVLEGPGWLRLGSIPSACKKDFDQDR